MIGCKFLSLHVLNSGTLFSIEAQELNHFYLKTETAWTMATLWIINRRVLRRYVIGEGNHNARKS